MLGGSLSWEQPQQLAAFPRESPFFGMTVPTDVTRQPAGAGRARCHAERAHLGDARRRHSARYCAAPRQGPDRLVSRHRRYALVRPAAIGHIRRDAQANRLLGGVDRCGRQRLREFARHARGGAADARARRLRRVRTAAADRPRRCRPASPGAQLPIIRPASMDRRKDCWRSMRSHPTTGSAPLDVSALNARRETYRMSEPQDLRGPILLAALALLALDAHRLPARRRDRAADAPPAAGGGRACARNFRRGAARLAAGLCAADAAARRRRPTSRP